jgi:hypothetical protein
MGGRDAVPTKKPYPYAIPEVIPPSNEEVARSNPSLVLEFFRIEAILRSEKAHRLYHEDGGEAILVRDYCFDWSVLDGRHHALLRGDTLCPSYPMQPIALDPAEACVENIAESFHYVERSERESYKRLLMTRVEHASQFGATELIVAIKTGYPWTFVERRLREMYEGLRDPYAVLRYAFELPHIPMPLDSSFFFVLPSGRSPLPMPLDDDHYELPIVSPTAPVIREPNAWLKYFQCYDLRHCEGLTFGEIAKRVYTVPTGRSVQQRTRQQSLYDEAERNFKKVGRLIRAAVTRTWPPHSL